MADYSINAVTRRVVYTGSAGVGPYSFTFEILAQTDIAVYKNSTKLALTTDYTVTINTNGTGSVTLVSSATSGDRITIIGQRAISRTTDFVTAGDLLASALNDQLDSQIIMLQQLAEENRRTMKAPQYDPASTDDGGTLNMTLPAASARANKVFAFDSVGNPVAGDNIGNWRGNWASGQTYYVRDLIKDTSNNNVYRCNTQHTASGSQPISSNSDLAKWDLVVDAASATSSASAAAASASAAATSATNAASSASSASSSASAASTSASTASTQASNASTSATNAATSATNAANSATAASSSASAAAASAASGLYRQVLDKSANYTIVSADGGSLFRASTGSGAITFTLPLISTVTDGFKIAIVKWTSDANQVTATRAGSDTINGATAVTIGSQYSQIILVADFETNTWFASQSGLGATNMNVDVFSGNGSTTAFTLSADPSTKNNVHVYVGGVYQYHSTYSTSGTTLTFTSAPPSGTSNIEVWYGTPLAVGTPSDATVTSAKLANAPLTYPNSVNEAATVTLASASTVNIGAAASNTISISGTTTITAFDTIAAGAVRRLVFAGILTLTHNATSLILPGGATITTAAGDVAEFVSLGSGNWRCFNYMKASGQAVVAPAAGVTSITAGTGLSGGTITTTGTISLTTTAGAIGTYAFCYNTSGSALSVGSTIAGSSLRYAGAAANHPPVSTVGGVNADLQASGTPSGTWQCMGYVIASGTAYGCGSYYGATLFIRIA